MKKMQRTRDFLTGAVTMALALALAVPVGAALSGKTIEVFTGIDVYVDDVKLEPKDVNGNPVEVFVYNGTTYLPIRAIGNALGKNVQYDAKTQSAYVGKHESEKPIVWLKDLDYFSQRSGLAELTSDTVQDNAGVAHKNSILGDWDHGVRIFDRTYKLNGQYSAITGTAFQSYDSRSDMVMKDTYLKIYADGEVIYECRGYNDYGFEAADFNLDLTGVLELRVELYNWGRGQLYLGDCGLWG